MNWGEGAAPAAFGIDTGSASGSPRPFMTQTRQHLLLAGLLLFLLGVQFRVVDSFTLNERSTHFVAARLGGGPQQAAASWQAPALRKVVQPPRWLGLALMSVGAVLTVKSLSGKGQG
jgi:hypothetical protein